ncbi:MAG TPA: hypothetical protein VFK34_08795 [Marmoricola sp.]|nr:hypothetical protein [Marmoricola sp.]
MITLLRADPRAGSVEPATAIVRPDTLTDQDAARIAATIDAARTESTRRVYAYTWGQWARWCAARELSALPDDPAALCAYLTERAAAGLAITSIDGACTAIRHVHRMQGMDDPVASEIVRQVRLGLRRTYGTAHPRPRRRPGRHPDHRPLLRAGHATTAALGGVPLARIAAQTRHRDLSVLVNRYIRPLEALATTSSRDLGL